MDKTMSDTKAKLMEVLSAPIYLNAAADPTEAVADYLLDNDVVPVVRCKDCKQWCRNVGIVDSPNGHCFYHDIDTNGHDFCSYGERKDNEKE